MQTKYINHFWLIGLFILQFQYLQAQIDVSLKEDLKFKYDLKKGSFSLEENNTIIFQDAISSFQLKGGKEQSISSTSAIALKQKFKDNLGSGICYSITHSLPDNIKAIQNFYFYEGSSSIIMEVVLKGKNISSNSISPLLVKPQLLLSTDSLTSVFVPFDNDTFIEYQQKKLENDPYQSSEVGILFSNRDKSGLITASLDQSIWKTGVLAHKTGDKTALQVKNGYTEVTVTRDSMEHGYLSGPEVRSSKILISYTKDWQKSLEDYAKLQRKLFPPKIKNWQEGTPVGWNSWGVIQTKLSFENATGNVDYFKNNIPGFRNDKGKAYIDLDSFWDNMVSGGMAGDYSKLKEFVAYCKSAGLEPGVYWAPFTDWGHGSGPDRKAEGSDYTFGEMWTKTEKGYHDLDGGRALDPTHPGTQARMKFILGKLKDCGFKMIKIDFLSHAAIESTGFYNPKVKTGMQAYAIGMNLLNDVLGNQMLIYAAISPSLATYKYAHIRRIACDAWKTLEQTKYTLNSISFGWWQTYLYDYIDADHLVFTGESTSINIARFLSGVVAGPLILGDDFTVHEDWQDQMEPILQNPDILKIINDGKSFTPIPVKPGLQTSNAYFKKIGEETYLIVFNFSEEEVNQRYESRIFGLLNENYKMIDLISKQETAIQGNEINISFENAGAKIFLIK